MSQTSEESRAVTLAFAHLLRDKSFRKFLSRGGFPITGEAVIALPDEQASDVFQRMFRQSQSPALIAISRPGAPHGFVFMGAVNGSREDAQDVHMGAGATIGMLYDTLVAQSGEYAIPQSWTKVRTLIRV